MMGGVRLAPAKIADIGAVMRVMEAAFDPAYGEAWSSAQMLTLFALPSARVAGPESELLLLAVVPDRRGSGIGARLIDDWRQWASGQGVSDYFLEMRADNDAVHLYTRSGFSECGRRNAYYRGGDGLVRDAITMRRSDIAEE